MSPRPLATLALCAVLLAGCATPGARPEGEAQRTQAQAALDARTERLAARDTWAVRARIAIRSEVEGWHATVQWRQHADDYHIDLVGPLGQGALRLTGDAHGVVLEDGNGVSAAASPEELLERETGWRLPVGGLRYWMRGLPQPGAYARFDLDLDGRLQHLEQDGWRIDFQRYGDYDGLAMPQRLDLRRADLRVRVVVDHWSLGAAQGVALGGVPGAPHAR